MTSPLDRWKALRDDQRPAVQAAWPETLPAPGHCTTQQEIAEAHAVIDGVVGFDEPIAREHLITAAANAMRAVGLIGDDIDHSEAAIVHAVGEVKAAPDLSGDELHAVWLTAQQMRRGRLVLRITDDDRPLLVTREANTLEHRLIETAKAFAAEMAKTPHPDDDRMGMWRHVGVTIGPTGDVMFRRLEGQQAAAHHRATEQPTTQQHKE